MTDRAIMTRRGNSVVLLLVEIMCVSLSVSHPLHVSAICVYPCRLDEPAGTAAAQGLRYEDDSPSPPLKCGPRCRFLDRILAATQPEIWTRSGDYDSVKEGQKRSKPARSTFVRIGKTPSAITQRQRSTFIRIGRQEDADIGFSNIRPINTSRDFGSASRDSQLDDAMDLEQPNSLLEVDEVDTL